MYSYLQSWLVCFLPFVTLNSDESTNTQLKSIVTIILGFATKITGLSFESFRIHIFTICFIAVATVTCIIWIVYKKARAIHPFILKIRGILFLYNPAVYYYLPSMFIGYQIALFQTDDISFSKIALILLEIIVIALATWFTFSLSPLLFQNPLFSKAHLPTTLFPNYNCVYHFLADIVYVIQVFNITSKIVQTLVSVIYFIYAIQHAVRLYRLPYLSHFLSAVSIAIDISHAVITPCAIWFSNVQCQTIFFLISAGSLILLIAIFYWILEYRGKKLVKDLESLEQLKIDKDKTILYVQEALLECKITKNLLNQIDPIFEGSTRLEVLAIHQYLKCIYADDPQTLQNIKRTILSLHMFKQLPTIQSFFLFELLHSVCKLERDTILSPENDLMKKYQTYEMEAERFWDSMIRGKLKPAMSALLELNRQIADFSKVFRSYNCLYPNNDMVLKLKQDFAYNVIPACTTISDTKIDLPMTHLQIRYAQFVGLRVDKLARLFFGDDEVEKSVIKATQIEMNIKSNIAKHVMKPLNNRSKAIFWIQCFVVVAFILICSVYPFFVLKRTRDISKFRNFSSEISKVASEWVFISITICQTLNQSVYDLVTEESLLESIKHNTSSIVTIQTLFSQLNDTLNDFIVQMRLLFIQNSYFSEAPPLSNIRQIFMDDKVNYFPYADNITESLDKGFQVKALLLFYFTYVSNFIDDLNASDPYNSTIAEHIRERAYKFSNITLNIMNLVAKTFGYIDEYVHGYIGVQSVSNVLIYILVAIIVLFIAAEPFTVYFFRKSVMSEISEDLKKYFRPHTQSPDDTIDEEYVEEIEEFPISTLIPKTSPSLGVMIGYAFFNMLLWAFIYKSYYEISSLLNTVNSIEKLDIDSAISLNSVLAAYQFANTTSDFSSITIDNMLTLYNDVFNYIKDSNETSVPLYEILNATRSNQIESEEFDSLHEFYHQISFEQLYLLIGYLTGTLAKNVTDGLGSPYIHSFHINFQTLRPIKSNLTYLYNSYLTEEIAHLGFLCGMDVLVYVMASILMFALFWRRYLDADDMKAQLGRLIMDLDPIFIAQNQCLVEFIVGSKSGVLPWMKGSPIFEILNSTDTPLLIINDHLSIMAFTSVIAEMFNYRPEQIIGQHYTMLFTIKGEAPSKSQESFFSRINDILSQKSGCTSKILSGITSDGNYLKVDVRASVITFDEHHYIFFELKSLEVSSFYDDATTLCQNTIKDMIETSIPLKLFPPIENGKGYLSRKFFGGTLVYCAMENNDIMRPINEMEEKMNQRLTQLYRGDDDCLVLAATISYSLLLFTNTDNTRVHRARALQYIKDYSVVDAGSDTKQVSVMLDVDQYFEAVQFLPPSVPAKYNGKEISAKESNNFSPQMTTDPFLDKLGTMGAMLSILRPNMVIMQAYMAEHLEKSCKLMPVTLVNNNEKFVGIAIDELPDASVMLEELKHDNNN